MAGVAQLVEHHLVHWKVAGSILIQGTLIWVAGPILNQGT